jgi:putative hydrolase of the HAD superfamily
MSLPHQIASQTTQPIRAVILDYGDVISLPRDPAVLSEMAAIYKLPEGEFRKIYDFFRHDYDRGSFDAQGYWRRIGEKAGVEPTEDDIARLREADVRMWARLNQAILRWADQLRGAGFKTAVLSNMHHDMVERVRSNGDWSRRFDCLTLSSAIRMAKPEPEIFKYCLNCLGVAAEEALFIDDREANVRAAEEVGIRGIVAPSTEALKAKLAEMGFEPVPE